MTEHQNSREEEQTGFAQPELKTEGVVTAKHFASTHEFAETAPQWMRKAVAEPELRAGIERFRARLQVERGQEEGMGRVPLLETITEQGVYIAVDECRGPGATAELKDNLRVYAAGFRDLERQDFEPLRPPVNGAIRSRGGVTEIALGHGLLRHEAAWRGDGGGVTWYNEKREPIEAHLLPEDLSHAATASERVAEARQVIGAQPDVAEKDRKHFGIFRSKRR